MQKLTELLEQTGADSSQCIRLVQNDGQPGLQVDVPHEGDQVIAAEERPVLSITVETAEGTRLTIVGVGSGDSDAPSRDGTY